MAWEYKIVVIGCGQRELESTLNGFSEDEVLGEGWEVFQVWDRTLERPQEVLLKRQKVGE